MPWLQLKINTPRETAAAVEAALEKSGSLSITLEDNADQPIFEPQLGETPLWHATRITGLFDANCDTQKIGGIIQQSLPNIPLEFLWQNIEDKDWEREWMKHYEPIQCHDNFWICPSWTPPPDANAINLMLDPGLAFGTGTHPTTFLCIQWIAEQNLKNKSVIDYGCGSGILGIAALLKGASAAVGIDIDPQALLASQQNTERNNIEKSRFPVYFPNKCPSEPVDVVLANILAGPLVELAEELAKLTKTNGKICLSGILEEQTNLILDAYLPFFKLDTPKQMKEWVCITGRKK